MNFPPELIERMKKVGGQETGRLAFEQLFDSPQVDAVTLTLMQKAASVADPELYKVAEQLNPESPMEFYEELGGGFKVAGSFDRAKGFSRVGQLLSGSRAKALHGAHEEASSAAGKHMMEALKGKHHPEAADQTMRRINHQAGKAGVSHGQAVKDLKDKPFDMDPKVRDNISHAFHTQENKIQATKASRIGKVLKAEEGKVRGARGVAGGVAAAGVAGGVSAARHKDSDKK